MRTEYTPRGVQFLKRGFRLNRKHQECQTILLLLRNFYFSPSLSGLLAERGGKGYLRVYVPLKNQNTNHRTLAGKRRTPGFTTSIISNKVSFRNEPYSITEGVKVGVPSVGPNLAFLQATPYLIIFYFALKKFRGSFRRKQNRLSH